MTISIRGEVSAPDGIELEVIECDRGLEQNRFRAANGSALSLSVGGSKTLVLLEVKTEAELAPLPGSLQHGNMAAPGAVSQPGHVMGDPVPGKALEDGDMDPIDAELDQTAFDALQRVLTVLHQFLETEGQAVQADLYHELSQAHRAYADAKAWLVAHRLTVAV